MGNPAGLFEGWSRRLGLVLLVIWAGHAAPQPLVFRVPPHARFDSPNSVSIAWETEEPRVCLLEFGVDEKLAEQKPSPQASTSHRFTMTGLQPRARYHYRIRSSPTQDEEQISERFELDNGLNYSATRFADETTPYPKDPSRQRYVQIAEQILSSSGVTRGYCLVLGCNEGQLAYELARQSELTIVGVDTDRDRLARARALLGKAGVYGSRITLRHVDSLDTLPFPHSFANLIVADALPAGGEFPVTAAQLMSLL